MSLLLHWLRWDLRRFQAALWLWCLSVAGYGLFVGNLNSDLQFADPDLFQWTQPLGIALLLMESSLLMRLFSSDACAGAQPFWKTRPPSGCAVGLSKIIIAAVFVLGVPLLAWWLVLTITGNGAEMLSDGDPVPRVTWMQRLWWAQCGLISGCLIAGSVCRPGWSIMWRALVVAAIFIAAAAMRAQVEDQTFSTQSMWQAQPPALWLLAAAGIFLLARWRRTPGRVAGWATVAVPALLALGSTAIPFLPAERPSYLTERSLAPDFAAQLRVGEPLLLTGSGQAFSYNVAPNAPESDRRGFPVALHLEGLPEDCRATGFWQDLTLVTPDGRHVRAVDYAERRKRHSTDRPVGWRGTPRLIVTAGAIFLQRDLADLGLVRCRMEGTLRLRVEKRRDKAFPFRLGTVMRGPAGHIRIDAVSPAIGERFDPSIDLLRGAVLTSELTEEAWWWLEQGVTGAMIPFWMRQDLPVTGWFVEPRMTAMQASAAISSSNNLAVFRLCRDAADGKLEEWNFHTGWYETLGYSEVRVVLHDYVVPFGDSKDIAKERMDALFPKFADGAGTEDVRSAVKYGLHLNHFERMETGEDRRLEALLASVQPGHLDVLLGLLKSEFPFSLQDNFKFPKRRLEDRIIQLLTPDAVDSVRKDKVLLHFLRSKLAEKGFIPKDEAKPPGMESHSDERLHAAWLRGDSAAGEALGEAVKRGLPWVPEAFGELAALQRSPTDFFILLSYTRQALEGRSDLTGDGQRIDDRWLLSNGPSLRWDTAAKRWVRPPLP